MSYTREQISEKLSKGVCTISYQNAEGETISRRATINESQIPAAHRVTGTSSAKANDNQFKYFDLDRDGYRSFNIDKLRSIEIV